MHEQQAAKIFLVRFEAVQPNYRAIINAWIQALHGDEAVDRARKEIENAGWTCERLDSVVAPNPDCEGREYYEQALIDKEVLVIYRCPWPPPKDA